MVWALLGFGTCFLSEAALLAAQAVAQAADGAALTVIFHLFDLLTLLLLLVTNLIHLLFLPFRSILDWFWAV